MHWSRLFAGDEQLGGARHSGPQQVREVSNIRLFGHALTALARSGLCISDSSRIAFSDCIVVLLLTPRFTSPARRVSAELSGFQRFMTWALDPSQPTEAETHGPFHIDAAPLPP